jgi:ketosteroid isomerase-like protein
MKHLKLMALLCLTLLTMEANAQSSDLSQIEATITGFTKAGDQSNSEKVSSYLDDNYRIVMNQLFGSTEVSVVPKSLYLEKIKSKEWGGDTRVITIKNVNVNGKTASAKVIQKGTKSTFVSTMVLLKDNAGNWKIVCDIPIIE